MATSRDLKKVGGVSVDPAAAPSDTTANPAAIQGVMGFLKGWTGAVWERVKSSSGRLIVDGSQVTQPVSMAAAPTGAALEATLLLIKAKTDNLDIALSALATALESITIGTALPAGSALIGKVGIDQTTPGTTNAVAPISGQAGVAGGAGAVGATTQRTVQGGAGTSTATTVASSATSVTLSAANASGLGRIIANDSTKTLFVELGTPATTASPYSLPGRVGGASDGIRSVLEVPFGYTGIITGIWSAVNGNASVRELTA